MLDEKNRVGALIERDQRMASLKKEKEQKIESKMSFENRAIDTVLSEFDKKIGNSIQNRNLQQSMKSERAREIHTMGEARFREIKEK